MFLLYPSITPIISLTDLHLSLPNIPLRLIADKEQVEQVLINLIRNARQIMHQHHVNITVQSKVGEGSTFTLLFQVISAAL